MGRQKRTLGGPWFGLVLVLSICSVPSLADWRDDFVSGLLFGRVGQQPQAPKRFIFISGLFSDLAEGSFTDAIETLEKSGVGKRGENIHYFTANSFLGLSENADRLAKEVQPLLSTPFEGETFLVGHSLGAVALWAASLSHSELFYNSHARLIFLQGPFQGSALAKAAEKATAREPSKVSESTPWWSSAVSLISSFAHETITKKLTAENVAEVLKQLHHTHLSSIRSRASERVLFLATNHGIAGIAQEFRSGNYVSAICSVGLMLAAGSSESDSVVETESQSPKGIPQTWVRTVQGFHHSSFTGTAEGGAALVRALVGL
jgi:pimeloyl-ACP methyl ester carboxylesterase